MNLWDFLKLCKSCNTFKLESDYYKCSHKCKTCYDKVVMTRRSQNIKEINDYKKSLSCETCGENHTAVLDFHHTNSKEKEYSISRMTSAGNSIDKIRKEVGKCIVLCSNCHRKLHWNERIRAG